MNLSFLVGISLTMFLLGTLGFLFKRNMLILFLSIELLLNAANLLFVAFAKHWGNQTGHVWVFFTLVIAAAEAAIGIAITINAFRSKQTVDVDQYNLLKE